MLWWLKHHTKKKRPAISTNNSFANGKGVSLDAILRRIQTVIGKN
jgi:hypothetical protein